MFNLVIKFRNIKTILNILYNFLILSVLVGHLCCNASYLINSLFDIDTDFIEFYISDEGDTEEENEELEEKQSQGQAFVFGNLIVNSIFASSANLVTGPLSVMQILAHFPMSDIMLPANALQ